MTTPLLSALAKLETITAKQIHLTPQEATALREVLGGRQTVREMVEAMKRRNKDTAVKEREA